MSLHIGRSGSGRQGVPTHVEHHSHRTVVSGGAGESLSSAPTGVEPAAENWDRTVRAVTSCFAHLLPFLLLLIDSTFKDGVTLFLCLVQRRGRLLGHTPIMVLLDLVIYMRG